MARVWADSKHSGSHLLMMLAIADFSDDDGNAYPAVGTLAEKCRMQPRNAQVILAALRQSGELEVRENEGPRGTNLYRIKMPQGVQSLAGVGVQAFAGVQSLAGVQGNALRGAKACAKPLQALAPEPSLNHQEPLGRARKRAPLSHFVPDDFALTPELEAWSAEKCAGVDLATETEKFRNHEYKTARSDWPRAWRNWMLRAASGTGSQRGTNRPVDGHRQPALHADDLIEAAL